MIPADLIQALSKQLTVTVEDSADERLGGPQKVGRKFVEYFRSSDRGTEQCKNNDEIARHIPNVDVKFKIYRLSDFDQVAGTVFVTFVLMLDWEDPTLSLVTNGEEPDFYEHFWPKVELLGLTPDGVADGPDMDVITPKYKRDKGNKKGFGEHRAALTMKWSTKLYVNLDFRDYPFDHQAVEIQIKLMSGKWKKRRKKRRTKSVIFFSLS